MGHPHDRYRQRLTCKFAMNQADINNDWDTYVAEVEAQNMQNIVDMYNDTYNASK